MSTADVPPGYPRVWAEPDGIVGFLVRPDEDQVRLWAEDAANLADLLTDTAERARMARKHYEEAVYAAQGADAEPSLVSDVTDLVEDPPEDDPEDS